MTIDKRWKDTSATAASRHADVAVVSAVVEVEPPVPIAVARRRRGGPHATIDVCRVEVIVAAVAGVEGAAVGHQPDRGVADVVGTVVVLRRRITGAIRALVGGNTVAEGGGGVPVGVPTARAVRRAGGAMGGNETVDAAVGGAAAAAERVRARVPWHSASVNAM